MQDGHLKIRDASRLSWLTQIINQTCYCCSYFPVIVVTSACVTVPGGGTPPGVRNHGSVGETALGVALALRDIAAAVELLASAVPDVVALIVACSSSAETCNNKGCQAPISTW